MRKLLLIILTLSSTYLSAQKVEGTVKDENGNPLSFASILVKGTSQGVTSNNRGDYSLSLSPGTYTLDCRFVGYTSIEKSITIKENENQKVDFVLSIQKLTLDEVVIKKGGEDPAYEIIRQAIKMRPEYEKEVKAFEAGLYIKGIIKLKHLPKSFMGKKIPEDNKEEMGLDSMGKGILYLSESFSKVYFQAPDKFKQEVKSSRVSGSNGIGMDFPAFISFYKNNVSVFASMFNPRGFVSPIADGALNFYHYKLMGIFFENGVQVNTIRVTPKRDYEPLFSGIINITENDWRIFSCNLMLTKKSQLEILDTLNISQIHMPVSSDVWRIKNQVLHFDFNQFGMAAGGDFVNVYSDYDLAPKFPPKFFDRIVIKYDTAVNKKTKEYWDTLRPIPLEPEEIKDYHFKDSLLQIRTDSAYLTYDSLRRKQGPWKIMQVLWSGVNRTHYDSANFYKVSGEGLIKTMEFNTVEGLAINPSYVWSKYLKQWNTNVAFIGDVRYGFNNQHLNPWAGLRFTSKETFDPDKKPKLLSYFLAGGKRVSQFFKQSDIDPLGNTVGSLLYGRNQMKIYENYFFKTGFTKAWESSARLLVEAGYEDRLPIDNTTDFILNEKWQHRYTPNYPVEVMNSQFTRHKAVVLHANFSIQPGQRYVQFPNYKMAIGSKLPTFSLDYTKGFKNILESATDFDKWAFTIHDKMNMKLAGSLQYNFSIGGFLNSNVVPIQDYKHFYSTISTIAGEYVKTFQNVTPYYFSNTSNLYTEIHLEHHSNGLLTNKIPLFKKLNWNLVEGANALFLNPNKKYAEVFVGLENIFKMFRVDAVVGFQEGFKPVYTYRIGFGGLLGDPASMIRFNRKKKIIDTW